MEEGNVRTRCRKRVEEDGASGTEDPSFLSFTQKNVTFTPQRHVSKYLHFILLRDLIYSEFICFYLWDLLE